MITEAIDAEIRQDPTAGDDIVCWELARSVIGFGTFDISAASNEADLTGLVFDFPTITVIPEDRSIEHGHLCFPRQTHAYARC